MRWTLLARHTSLAVLAASALLVQGSPALASTAPARIAAPLPAAAPAVPAAAPAPVPSAPVPAGPNAPSPAAPAAPVIPVSAPVGEIQAMGSPTQTVTRNADGTTTVKITPGKSRFKDPSGVWRDLDLTLVPGPDGLLGANAGDGGLPRIAKATNGAAGLVSAPTKAGMITSAHPGTAAGVVPRLAGPSATFGKADAGRDVQVQLRPDGFEESLVLASPAALTVPGGAGAAGSYTETFTVPTGVSARQAPTGVEFVDTTGRVVASYGGGSAQDSKIDPRSGDAASSPVATTLVGQSGAVATVRVAANPAWLADPVRVFPITVDPTFTADTSSEGAGGFDTYTYSPNPNTAEGSYDPNILKVGSFDGGASRARSYVVFNLNGFQNTQVAVQSAQLSLFNTYSYGCDSGGQSIFAQAAGGSFYRNSTTWNNQPNGDPASPNIGSGPFAHGHDSSCGADWVRFDIGAQAQRWSNGATNLGVVLTSSDETNSFGWRRFANGTSGGTSPSLVITYGTNNCTYYPQTGHSVCGAIRDHYNALGGPNSFLGYPTSDELTLPDGIGKMNTFQNGNDRIYWSPATGAQEIGGAIFAHWGNYGYETGALGYPTSDELGTPNGAGRYNMFQNAGDHIYWTPSTGAQEIGGSIFTKWGEFKYEAGPLGFPITDETGTPDRVGRFNHFQGSNGSIYYSPATGTHEIAGAIYNRWAQTGYEGGVLGYPTTDERAASTEFNGTQDRQNDFAHGSIYFNTQNGVSSVQANPQLLTGSKGFFTTDTTTLSDRVSASVNRGTGNLQVNMNGLSAPGVLGNTGVGLTYNSLAQAPGAPYPSGAAGRWHVAGYQDVAIKPGPGYVDYQDASGAVWRFAGGGNGPFTPPAGLDADLTHTGTGWTIKVHASATVSGFDTGGNLTSVTDRNNNVTTYSPTTVTGSRGAGDGRTVHVTSTNGRISELCQSTTAASCTGTATRSDTTLVVDYAYDTAGNLTSVTDPAGKTTSFGYDTGNPDAGMQQNLVTVTDPTGIVTHFGMDSIHRISSLTRDNGGIKAQTVYDYITVDTHTRVADPTHPRGSGVFTDDTVAPGGKLTSATDAKGQSVSVTWTSDNQVQTATNARAGVTTNTYTQPTNAPPGANGNESLGQSQSPMGSTTSSAYTNPAGPSAYSASSSTDSSGNKSTYTYNGAGNLMATQNAMAATAAVTFNPDGTVATSTDPNNASNGKSSGYAYDGAHNPTSVTPPGGDNSLAPITSSFDGFGRPLTSGTGLRATTYGYDRDGRVVTATHSDNSPALVTGYDDVGRVVAATDGNGTATTTYTALGQVKTSTRSGAAPANTTYTYDAAGHMLSMADGRGTTSYHYDKLGLLDQLTESGGPIDLFAYNQDHQRIDSYYNTSGTNGAAATYDTAGNTLQAPAGFAVHAQSTLDQAGRLTETRTTRASSNSLMVSDITYCYSPYVSGRPCPGGTTGTDTGKRQYASDLITGALTTYTYDQAGRLTTATTTGGPAPATYGYCYDADGNRTTEGANNLNCSAPTHTYNSVNQLTSNGATHDVNGNQTAPAPLTATSYNSGDQTTGFTPAGPAPIAGAPTGPAPLTATYGGNGQNQRLSFGTTTYANGSQGVLSASTAGASTYYERDPSGALIAERGAGGEFYYVTDGLGSTIALVDTAGTVQATYTYDPYGDTTNIGGPNPVIANGNPYRYAGGYLDTATGLYHFGARYYNPTLGRFTQPDPSGQETNTYLYATGNPITFADPTGLATACGVAVAVLGGVSAIAAVGAAVATGGIAVGVFTSIGLSTGIASGVTGIASLFSDNC